MRKATLAVCTRFEPDLVEGFELPEGPAATRDELAHVRLDRLLRGHRALVGDVDAERQGPVRPDARALDLEVRVRELRVAQAEPEGVERGHVAVEIARCVAVVRGRPARRQHVVGDRDLPHRARERHRQFARRRDLAAQDLGERDPRLGAALPRKQDGRGVRLGLGERERPPGADDEDDGRAARRQRASSPWCTDERSRSMREAPSPEISQSSMTTSTTRSAARAAAMASSRPGAALPHGSAKAGT